MKCEQGDLAKIIFSLNENNIGKIVLVDNYIGKFNAGGSFNFRGIACVVPVADHYWWISGCLLYTSDAADEQRGIYTGGSRSSTI